MNIYENRLKSFESWPGRENVKNLALVGFYYTGYTDHIVCQYCKLDLYNFTLGGEDSLRDHKRYSPDCPFFTINTTNYVNTRFLSPRIINSNYHPGLTPPPYKCDYSLLEQRIYSFINFPTCLKTLVEDLSDAGFYYTNVGDYVCCYACGVIGKDWTTTSDVWRVHKRLNDRCSLVLLKKLNHNNNNNNNNNNNDNTNNLKENYNKIVPTAPTLGCLPKCKKCKLRCIDAVLLPCYHFCVCQECALLCTTCVFCNVFTGGFLLSK
ncbi:inhibitor of apoptosis 5 [Diatraea saccharalis granulovirus]|uniref:Inhibitor of apoptosis 5 n=1 Tax=Diatraea saccharalis granulovirus TaxID=1675862 RepID=A0A0R7EYU8_9BBAC|nr:inhibitor of apoptosis 5 [Diatraea saccharalis granulovirus]AKN80754.1 inhibitor of apoptosis 5 [Diatraea saccharalis granulovirus]